MRMKAPLGLVALGTAAANDALRTRRRARQRCTSSVEPSGDSVRFTCCNASVAATGCSPQGLPRTHRLMAAAERRRQLQSHFREDDKPPQTPENRATKTWRRALRHEPDSPLEALAPSRPQRRQRGHGGLLRAAPPRPPAGGGQKRAADAQGADAEVAAAPAAAIRQIAEEYKGGHAAAPAVRRAVAAAARARGWGTAADARDRNPIAAAALPAAAPRRLSQ